MLDQVFSGTVAPKEIGGDKRHPPANVSPVHYIRDEEWAEKKVGYLVLVIV